jgi:hypothetical protein
MLQPADKFQSLTRSQREVIRDDHEHTVMMGTILVQTFLVNAAFPQFLCYYWVMGKLTEHGQRRFFHRLPHHSQRIFHTEHTPSYFAILIFICCIFILWVLVYLLCVTKQINDLPLVFIDKFASPMNGTTFSLRLFCPQKK